MAGSTVPPSEYKIFGVLSRYPLVSSSVKLVADVYNKSKVYSRLSETTLSAVEGGVRVALDKTKPIVAALGPGLHVVDDLAVKGLTSLQQRVELVDTRSRQALGTAHSVIAVKVSTVTAFGRQQCSALAGTVYVTAVSNYTKSALTAVNSAIDSRLDQASRTLVPESADLPDVLAAVLRNAVSYAGQLLTKPIAEVKAYSADFSQKMGDTRIAKDVQDRAGTLYHEILGDQKVPEDAPLVEKALVTYGRLLLSPFRRYVVTTAPAVEAKLPEASG